MSWRARPIGLFMIAAAAACVSGCTSAADATAWRAPAVGVGKDMGTISIPMDVDWPPRVLLEAIGDGFTPGEVVDVGDGEAGVIDVEAFTDTELMWTFAVWPSEASARSGDAPREAFRYRLAASPSEGRFDMRVHTWGLVEMPSPTPHFVCMGTMAVYGHLMAPK